MDVNKIRTIIGMDFGDGESAASVLKIRNRDGSFDEEYKIEALFLDNSTSTKKPTTVTVGENGQFIGFGDYDSNSGSMIQHFKRSPGEWNYPAKNVQGKTITSKDCMFYFIKSFINCIRNVEQNKRWFDGDMNSVALFVGCPSGKKWTEGDNREKYETMIREATGMKNVCVIPESTAAVFSALRINEKDKTKHINFSLDDGIAVYDFGSSTSDFTYMLLGEKLIELSWRLGAASIEANMWSRALADNEGITPWMGKTDNYIMALRKLKEQWFGDFQGDPNAYKNLGDVDKQIIVVQADPQNPGKPKMKVNAYTGSQIMDTAVMDITMCSAYIEHCLGEAKVENVEESGTSIDPASYNVLVKRFFERGKELMDKHKVPYRTVIITGGASRMDLIRNNCQAVFGSKVRIINDPSPSYCVSDGLCQVASNVIKLEPICKKEKEKAPVIAKKMAESFRTSLQDQLIDTIYDTVISVMKSVPGEITVNEFKQEVDGRIVSALNEKKIESICRNAFDAMNSTFQNSVKDMDNRIVREIYHDESLAAIFANAGNLFSSDIVGGRVKMGSGGAIDVSVMLPVIINAVANVVAFAVGAALFVVLAQIPVIGPILAVIVGPSAFFVVRSLIQNHPNYKIRPSRYVNRVTKDKVREKTLQDNEFKQSIDDICAKAISVEKANQMVYAYIDDLCGVISLQKFDETIHS